MNLGSDNANSEPTAPPPYLSLYHLSRAPFTQDSDAAFFYADPASTHILSSLRELSNDSREVLIVCGQEGSGKSTLLQQFLDHVLEDWRLCHQQAKKGFGAEVLLDKICECFDHTPTDGTPEQQLEELLEYISKLTHEEPAVIVVDDAHLLSEDALFMLMRLAGMRNEVGGVTHVVLFAEPEIDAALNSDRFADYPTPHRFEIQSLDELQTAIYVNHRLEVAGYKGKTIFSNAEIKQIHRTSSGIAGRINDEAHNVMMLHWQAGGSAGSNTRRYLKIGLAVFAALILVVMLRGLVDNISDESDSAKKTAQDVGSGQVAASGQNSGSNTVSGNEQEAVRNSDNSGSEKVEIPIALPPAKGEDGIRVMGTVQPVESDSVNQSVEGAQTDVTEVAPGAITSETRSNENMALVVKSQTKPEETQGLKLTGVKPSPLSASDSPQRIVIEGTGFVEGSRIALNRAGQVTLIPESQIEWISAKELAIKVTTGKVEADWAVQVGTPDNHLSNVLFFKVILPQKKSASSSATAPGDEKISKSLPANVIGTESVPSNTEISTAKTVSVGNSTRVNLLGSDWLVKQPKQNYTLQLLASNSRFNVTTFVREHPQLQGPLASISTNREGSRYYVLMQGSYPTRALADQAAAQLPDGLDSWPRIIENLQQEMVSEVQAGDQTPLTHVPVQGQIKDTAWVWSQDPTRFTVQLAAAENEQSIEDVTRQLNLPGELVVVQTLHEGKHWYVLIYGSYESKDAAHTAIDKLPLSLRKTGPWPRSFASLQSELSRATP